MTFTFHGTREALAARIEAAAAAEGRDIYIDDKYPDRMEIGYERQGHQGGRFFYAAITEHDGILTLTGEAEDSHRHSMSPARRMWDTFSIWAGGLLFVAFCGLILWVVADDLGVSPIPFWIILMIPVVWIWRRQPIIRLEQQQRDQDFFDFLTRALHPNS